MSKLVHLRFDLYDYQGPHAQLKMKELGIKYQLATPQSMGDQWWFWNCENVPDPLPAFLSVADLDPMKCIGWGIGQEDADAILRRQKEAEC